MQTELTDILALVKDLIHKAEAESHEWWFVILGLAILTLLFWRHWRIIAALFLPLFAVDTANSFYAHFLHGTFPVNPEYPPLVALGFSLLLIVFWAQRPRPITSRTEPEVREPLATISPGKPDAP
jgi:hypothetical protein